MVSHSESTYGAGLRSMFSNVELSHLKFKNNTSYTNGGAIYAFNSNLIVKHCEFISNQAPGYYSQGQKYDGDGGAVMVECLPNYTADFSNCDFIDNYGLWGGAVYTGMNHSGSISFEGCHFENNESDKFGGAAYLKGDTITIKRCTYKGNTGNSSAVIIAGNNAIIENSLFVNNSGAMELYNGDAVISNSTIADNQCINKPVYIDAGATVYVYNSILWNICGKEFDVGEDSKLFAGASVINGGKSSVVVSDTSGKVFWQDSIYQAWPEFVGWSNYHLEPNSPCIGAGVDSINMNSLVYICNESGELMGSYIIFDLSGKKILSERTSSGKIDISRLLTGIYIVKIELDNHLITKKMVIQ